MDANTEVLQAAAQATFGRDLNGALRTATGVRLDANGICKRLWGKEFNEAFSEMLGVLSSRALLLPGTSGSYASTPDTAVLDIVGDLDIRVEYVATTRTPAGTESLMGKWDDVGNQRGYRISLVTPFGFKGFVWSTNGIDSPNSTTDPGTQPFNIGAYRATIDVDNGAAGRTITHYSAPSLDGPWTAFKTDVQAGVTSIFANTAPLHVGALSLGVGSTPQLFTGRITRAELRSGINGTVVANPDFRNLAPGTTSFADGTGKTWTLHGGARVV